MCCTVALIQQSHKIYLKGLARKEEWKRRLFKFDG